MPAITRVPLSGSTNGRPIGLSNVASTTIIHTATSTADVVDQMILACTNVTAGILKLILEVGGTAFGDQLEFQIPANHTLALPINLQLSGGVIVYGVAPAATNLLVHGYVQRIDQSA